MSDAQKSDNKGCAALLVIMIIILIFVLILLPSKHNDQKGMIMWVLGLCIFFGWVSFSDK